MLRTKTRTKNRGVKKNRTKKSKGGNRVEETKKLGELTTPQQEVEEL